jgi:hypothetical protein
VFVSKKSLADRLVDLESQIDDLADFVEHENDRLSTTEVRINRLTDTVTVQSANIRVQASLHRLAADIASEHTTDIDVLWAQVAKLEAAVYGDAVPKPMKKATVPQKPPTSRTFTPDIATSKPIKPTAGVNRTKKA